MRCGGGLLPRESADTESCDDALKTGGACMAGVAPFHHLGAGDWWRIWPACKGDHAHSRKRHRKRKTTPERSDPGVEDGEWLNNQYVIGGKLKVLLQLGKLDCLPST